MPRRKVMMMILTFTNHVNHVCSSKVRDMSRRLLAAG
jgi:hypothetical protein